MDERPTIDELRTELGQAKAELAVASTREQISRIRLRQARQEAASASERHKTDKQALDAAQEAAAALVRRIADMEIG